jgi:glycine/D-amino acid oxidase-like deaminating enzyme
MIVLIMCEIPNYEDQSSVQHLIHYIPCLNPQDVEQTMSRLDEIHPHVIVTESAITAEFGERWRRSVGSTPLLAFVRNRLWSAEHLTPFGIEIRPALNSDSWLDTVLSDAEEFLAKYISDTEDRMNLDTFARSRIRTVALIGAGIVNLMTAHSLARAGFQIRIFERSPDFRGGDNWTVFGCSRGGDNARMLTLTETDYYFAATRTNAGPRNQVFRKPVSEAGWRIGEPNQSDRLENAWLDRYERTPGWLARSYNRDIFYFNSKARHLWEELRSAEPDLFQDIALTDGILRLYTDRRHLEMQIERQKAVGAYRRALDHEEIVEGYPALRTPASSGRLAGGIEVTGFTLNVHGFMAKIIDKLESESVVFHWDTPIAAPMRDQNGKVTGVISRDGREITADSFVVSLGAHGREFLAGTRVHGVIHGVLGVWLAIPNPEPALGNSLKISRKLHIAEDSNVTVSYGPEGERRLIIGSGYGWTGADPSNVDSRELARLHEAVKENANYFFPEAYERAEGTELLSGPPRFCVRPWTASCLGVFDMEQTATGGAFVVTGGHNTGGFTQAPIVAEAVVAALQGVIHPMHRLYRRSRL